MLATFSRAKREGEVFAQASDLGDVEPEANGAINTLYNLYFIIINSLTFH